MKLTMLVDNYTLIDAYYLGEPAVSYWIETEGKSYLFDAGYSDVFIKNAEKMEIDLSSMEAVILSHGHDDHTRGLAAFPEYYKKKNKRKQHLPRLIAHPEVFAKRRDGDLSIGCPVPLAEIEENFMPELSRKPVWLTKKLVFLGEIKRNNEFEAKAPIGEIERAGSWQPDDVMDDSALVYCSDEGLVIITGCSHAGICNIISSAKEICQEERICSVIGGFHLLHTPSWQMEKTVAYLAKLEAKEIYAAHCTDLAAKIALAKELPLQEAGVGRILSYC